MNEREAKGIGKTKERRAPKESARKATNDRDRRVALI
jgi:hypothetical protein